MRIFWAGSFGLPFVFYRVFQDLSEVLGNARGFEGFPVILTRAGAREEPEAVRSSAAVNLWILQKGHPSMDGVIRVWIRSAAPEPGPQVWENILNRMLCGLLGGPIVAVRKVKLGILLSGSSKPTRVVIELLASL